MYGIFWEKPAKDEKKKNPDTISFMRAVDFKLNRQKERYQKKLLAKATTTKWETTKTKLGTFTRHKFQTDNIPIEKVEMTFADDFSPPICYQI